MEWCRQTADVKDRVQRGYEEEPRLKKQKKHDIVFHTGPYRFFCVFLSRLGRKQYDRTDPIVL